MSTAGSIPIPGTRVSRALALALAALCLFPLSAWVLLTPSASFGSPGLATVVLVGTAGAAVFTIMFAAERATGRARLAWRLLALGIALWGGAELAGSVAPAGSLANRLSSALVFAGFPTAVLALLLLSQPAGTRPALRVLTGAVATTLSMAALLWTPVLGPVSATADLPVFDRLMLEATVIGGLGLVFALFVSLQDREQHHSETILAIAGLGLAVFAAGTLAGIRSAATDPVASLVVIDVVAAAGIAIVGLGAAGHVAEAPAYALNRDHRRPTSLVRQAIPLIASVTALGLAAVQPGSLSGGALPGLLFSGVAATLLHEVLVLYDQLQLNNMLRHSEASLQRRHTLVVDSSPDLIAVIGLDGRYEYVNPAYGRILGYQPATLVGSPILKMVDRRDAPAMFGFLTMARSEPGSTGIATLRFRTADGRARVFECGGYPLRDEEGNARSLVMVSRDITERQAAERRLRNSEARKGALFTSAPDAILSIDADGVITECNPAAEVLFDLDASDLAGHSFDDVITAFDDRDIQPFRALREHLADSSGHLSAVVCTGRRADGDDFPAEVSVSQVEGAGAEGFIVFVRDVSERVKVEARLRDSQKLEAIGRLAGGVAHDFNNLLTVIHGYAEFAQGAAPTESQIQEDVGEIIRASERARDLTRQLLAFARRQVVEPRTVSPNEIVSGMEKMLGRLVGEDVRIVTELEDEVGDIHIDPGQFEQVVVNLVVNARDAMPQGGTVTVTTENVPAADVSHYAPSLQPGDYVVVSVADSGVGMSGETMAHVFEPFFTTKGPGAGVGLGLATCYGIAKQGGGEITVESEIGKGTIFRVWLPRVAHEPAELARPVPREVQGGYETILFVEDERGIRTLTERFLRSLGYRVLVAGDGHEALRMLQTAHEPIHLLISDVVMPRMSGLDLADRVLARSPGTHILFISGYPRDVLAERGVLPREVSLLAKPFTFEALALRVRDALDRTRSDDPERGGYRGEALDPVAAEVERRLRGRYTA